MALSNFDSNGNLHPGIYSSTWEEVRRILVFNPRRQELFKGLKNACKILKNAGCDKIYIGGSFATNKECPGDFDVCWKDDSVDFKILLELDPVLLDFSNKRAKQKAKYGGELFLASAMADAQGQTFLEFFRKDRNGNPKGILEISL
ncbi:hypothetical protein Xen7305DRAFT_00033400 [Xenococcus sp. PCC 7305]|uniref:DUF6932 family protein n=1 Tax=Xenococcus sp. PCC 7305 TaxID=102125 RepID=UPI0002AC5818|nr:hypothetical protein [Xenococcus sp. PCC 7305]ELS03616.1 hypothetical protein Xen7305DRAFT_00033400 [Xenococcus sp. PCC 7305]